MTSAQALGTRVTLLAMARPYGRAGPGARLDVLLSFFSSSRTSTKIVNQGLDELRAALELEDALNDYIFDSPMTLFELVVSFWLLFKGLRATQFGQPQAGVA